ncbi:hypothetical protein A3J78_00400 [Candidatus Beckwithbacteria bacterium RBG_13_35_6]|uniref:DUF4012 domain-containing protein n=1 Tax=Candidatus Beckwithbacteria bacterium RBG_13_35_6 TaxID=1797456 RepID=A0A1F5DHI5_9BACT|nr:MAG: hypothetical protein A3J78_00400 [Candidatus Beckwithbacteria bacterium RBG_13_35_6]
MKKLEKKLKKIIIFSKCFFILAAILSTLTVSLTLIIFLVCFNIYQVGKAGKTLATSVLENNTPDFDKSFLVFQKQIKNLKKKVNLLKPAVKILPLKYQDLYSQAKEALNLAVELNKFLPEFLGKDREKTYFTLLQNHFELRPTGGFMGSYAKLKFAQGGLNSFTVHDIYVPDGQLEGHVDPPWPIQEAFKHGFWKLRDSNWDPDFPTAIKQISWFFDKGNEEQADGFIAINFLLIKDLLDITGPIKTTNYDYLVNKDNFYQIAQNEAETDFFPGSTQKKDFLSSLSKELFFKLQNLDNQQYLQLIRTVFKNLNEKQILLNFKDNNTANFINKYGWGGLVKRKFPDSNETINDYVYIVDTNLGANKANCCIERKVKQNISLESNSLSKENLTIIYKNSSITTGQRPPLFWGGIYKNFLRVILPIEAENITIKVDAKQYQEKVEILKDEDKKLKTVGFFIIVNPLSEVIVEIEYSKPITNINANTYQLEIQKEPGIKSYQHTINFKSALKNYTDNLEISTDKIIKFDIK